MLDMISRLGRVLVRSPDESACVRWADFGWRSAPDPARLRKEHEGFVAQLADLGAEIVLGGTVPGGLDAIYTFDPAIVAPGGAIVLRIGKDVRLPEAPVAAADLEAAGLPVLARLEAPATVDGGDTIWLDDRTLLVGRGYRTNAAGVAALRAALPGVDVVEFDLPHFHGRDEVMHLLSLISPVAHDLAVAYLPLLPVRLVQLLEEREVRLVEVPDDEFDSMGANVLALEPGVVLMLERNRETRRRLERAGVSVETYAGIELSKGDGGPTCLTRPLARG